MDVIKLDVVCLVLHPGLIAPLSTPPLACAHTVLNIPVPSIGIMEAVLTLWIVIKLGTVMWFCLMRSWRAHTNTVHDYTSRMNLTLGVKHPKESVTC